VFLVSGGAPTLFAGPPLEVGLRGGEAR
jgi:hypothetical protein